MQLLNNFWRNINIGRNILSKQISYLNCHAFVHSSFYCNEGLIRFSKLSKSEVWRLRVRRITKECLGKYHCMADLL